MDNLKNGSAEALSPVFLADWLLVLPLPAFVSKRGTLEACCRAI